MKLTKTYTFADVLLKPQYSEIASRSSVDLSTDLGKGIVLKIPIISANMVNVTGKEMALKMAELGGMGMLHRFFPNPKEPVEFCKEVNKKNSGYLGHIGFSLGVQESDYGLADELVDAGARILCVDVAHGDSKLCNDMVAYLAKKHAHVLIVAGNVATGSGLVRLVESGANTIKVNVGAGSVCTTRVKTGNGVPQLSALWDCYEAARKMKVISRSPFSGETIHPKQVEGCRIISDGGCKEPGDMVKALCFSHALMLGNALGGSDEAPGKIVTVKENGKEVKYKEYAGSSTLKSKHIEGVVGLLPCRGKVADVLEELVDHIRSGLSYQGANNLEELRDDPEFVEISSAGLVESLPHDIKL